MTLPTFTILIGSACRPSLVDTLESIKAQQRIPGDQVIVGIDALDQDFTVVDAAIRVVRSHGKGFHAFAHIGVNTSGYTKETPAGYAAIGEAGARFVDLGAPYHWLGVEQINQAIRTIPIPDGSYVTTLGDDDVLTPTCYEDLRPIALVAARTRSPLLTRFIAPSRELLWDKPRMRACAISGCCMWAPAPVPLHPTDIETTHDYRWMQEILARHADMTEGKWGRGGPPIWVDYVGVIARPHPDALQTIVGQLAPRIVIPVEDEG